jgi:hypothetical protein
MGYYQGRGKCRALYSLAAIDIVFTPQFDTAVALHPNQYLMLAFQA